MQYLQNFSREVHLRTKFLIILFTFIQSQLILASTDFSKVEFNFQNTNEAAQFLATKDDYINNLSTLDLSLYHGTSNTISINEHLQFLTTTPLEWSSNEKDLIRKHIESFKDVVTKLKLNLNLPTQILLIKTNGADAFNSHYTRSNAIIFPALSSQDIQTDLATFYHEMFHIFSRYNPTLTDDLFSLINFKRINRFIPDSELEKIRTTNPDAFFYDHAVNITKDNSTYEVIPFMYSAIKQDDIQGPVDESLVYKLGLLDLNAFKNKTTVMFKVSETNYKDIVSANSHYYIHPEEILAEDFKLLLLQNTTDAATPKVKYQAVLDNLLAFFKKVN
jgi:hypothetical protein